HPPGRDLRLPRPERGGQVDDRPHADDAPPALRRAGYRRGLRRGAARAPGARVDRRCAAGGGARSVPHRPRAPASAGVAARDRGRAAAAPDRRAPRARRAHARRRSQGAHVLGRHEAPSRSRAGADPRPVDPLPRRADDRARPAEPHGSVGRGRPARARRGRDGVPHDAVPRGGGRPRRPRRDHRPRHDRRRGNAGTAEGADRPADGGDRPGIGRRAAAPARAAPALRRRDGCAARRVRRAARRARDARRRRARSRHGGSARGADQPARADARRRLPGEDGTHPRRRRRGMSHQIWLIARRSVVRTFRQPGVWFPPLAFPLMLMAVNSNGLRAATHLRGFPTHSFLAFFLPFSFLQGALFASGIAGTDLARDIDTGFLNRLALTPVSGAALLLGQIGGAVGLGIAQTVVYLGVALAAGVHIDAGVGGALLIVVLAILIVIAWGNLGLWIALRTGSGEGVQSQFPLLFFVTFISSINLPRNLISVTWFRDIATINPVSYMIESLRSLVIVGWDGEALALGFLCIFGLMAVSLFLSVRQLKVRMTRT